MFDYRPGGPWADQLAAPELPLPPAATRIRAARPGRVVTAGLAGGGTAQGKVIAWARSGAGWACLIIWSSQRYTPMGRRWHARWGWHVYDPAVVRDEPDFFFGTQWAPFEDRYLPGYDETLAELRALGPAYRELPAS